MFFFTGLRDIFSERVKCRPSLSQPELIVAFPRAGTQVLRLSARVRLSNIHCYTRRREFRLACVAGLAGAWFLMLRITCS